MQLMTHKGIIGQITEFFLDFVSVAKVFRS